MTHTYVLLEVSPTAHTEIAQRLRDADYDHVFGGEGEIDMHGIALVKEPCVDRKGNCPTCGALIYLDHAHICNTERIA